MKDNDLSELLTPGELEWFGQWQSKSRVLEGNAEAAKTRPNPSRALILQVLEASPQPGRRRPASLWQAPGKPFRRRNSACQRQAASQRIGAAFPDIAPWRALAARRLRHTSINKQITACHEAGHAAADWNFGFKIKQVTMFHM